MGPRCVGGLKSGFKSHPLRSTSLIFKAFGKFRVLIHKLIPSETGPCGRRAAPALAVIHRIAGAPNSRHLWGRGKGVSLKHRTRALTNQSRRVSHTGEQCFAQLRREVALLSWIAPGLLNEEGGAVKMSKSVVGRRVLRLPASDRANRLLKIKNLLRHAAWSVPAASCIRPAVGWLARARD